MQHKRTIPLVPDSPLPDPVKGRGTPWAIEHRFSGQTSERFDDGWGTLEQEVGEEHVAPATTIIEERVKSILSHNDSPDVHFDLSINPYRGCEHGCVYCFARPTHSYLNMSPGLDFETRIIAKVNAAQRLREALASRSYQPLMLNVGSATDAYQPVERKLGITRSIIEVLAECRHPFSVVTKSSGIERDLDLIAPLAADRLVAVYLSITSLDPQLARILEPRAAAPHRRLRTMETLAKAGVPVGVSVSPVIPFINEPEIERILEAAAAAGATSAFSIVLRLPWEVNPIFQQWLQAHFPERAARVLARLRDMRAPPNLPLRVRPPEGVEETWERPGVSSRGGKDYDARWGARMKGEGVWAQLLQQRFTKAVSVQPWHLESTAVAGHDRVHDAFDRGLDLPSCTGVLGLVRQSCDGGTRRVRTSRWRSWARFQRERGVPLRQGASNGAAAIRRFDCSTASAAG